MTAVTKQQADESWRLERHSISRDLRTFSLSIRIIFFKKKSFAFAGVFFFFLNKITSDTATHVKLEISQQLGYG